jgi:hypothetical protein
LLPEVEKSVFAQFVIDCQTPKEYVSCDYCIGKENCKLRKEIKEKESICD